MLLITDRPTDDSLGSRCTLLWQPSGDRNHRHGAVVSAVCGVNSVCRSLHVLRRCGRAARLLHHTKLHCSLYHRLLGRLLHAVPLPDHQPVRVAPCSMSILSAKTRVRRKKPVSDSACQATAGAKGHDYVDRRELCETLAHDLRAPGAARSGHRHVYVTDDCALR
jgi:hypothetical protein